MSTDGLLVKVSLCHKHFRNAVLERPGRSNLTVSKYISGTLLILERLNLTSVDCAKWAMGSVFIHPLSSPTESLNTNQSQLQTPCNGVKIPL